MIFKHMGWLRLRRLRLRWRKPRTMSMGNCRTERPPDLILYGGRPSGSFVNSTVNKSHLDSGRIQDSSRVRVVRWGEGKCIGHLGCTGTQLTNFLKQRQHEIHNILNLRRCPAKPAYAGCIKLCGGVYNAPD